jgi:hypothetical protein
MSVMNQDYAVPGRVLGVYRTVRAYSGPLTRDELSLLMAPRSLEHRGTSGREAEEADEEEGGVGRDMVAATAEECQKMGLLTPPRGGDKLGVPASHAVDDEELPGLLTRLLLDPAGPNTDLGLSLAWFLAQDPASGPTSWDSAEGLLREQMGQGEMRAATGLTNPNPYRMLEYWACYLGFARSYARRGKRVVSADPTAYLRRSLPALFDRKPGRPRSLAGVMNKLKDDCPVLEGGTHRRQTEKALTGKFPARPENQLSGTTSLAWLRLEEEGLVRLTRDADARDKLLLSDGPQSVPCSLVTWIEEGSRGV